MAYESLKQQVNTYIAENHSSDITAELLNDVLIAMIDALGEASGIVGIVPTSEPQAGDANITYIALQDGTYTNFGNTVVANEVALIKKVANTWVKVSYAIPAQISNVTIELRQHETPSDTPTGSASLAGNTLQLVFWDLKGVKGDKGDTVHLAMEIDATNIAGEGNPTATIEEVTPAPEGYDQMFKITVANLKGSKGDKGDTAVNPFKGWFTTDNIPTTGQEGDYCNVSNTSVTPHTVTIYRWDATQNAFVDTGEVPDTATGETFASGETLQQVAIDGSELVNPVNTADPTKPVLAKAEDVMQLKAKLEGVTASETKVQIVESGEGQNVFAGKVVGATGAIENNANYKYVEFEIPSDVKSIRFMTPTGSGWTGGWATGHYNDGTFVKDRSSAYVSGTEFTIEVKEGETHFRTNCYMMYGTTPTNRLLGFYCYLQSGDPALNRNDIANDFLGGKERVLSAEIGKQIANNISSIVLITEYTTISPQAGGVYTWINDKKPGDQVEETRENVSTSNTLLKYSIDASKTYYGTLKPQININLGNVYVYFWADANGLLIKKEKTLSSTYENNTWENYVLTPPEGAVTLYVQARTEYLERYSVSEIQFVTLQEVEDDIRDLEANMVEKSDLTVITPLMPIDELFKYIDPHLFTINEEGINIEEYMRDSERYVVYKFEVKPETTYNVTGKNTNQSLSGVYAYYWADENGGYISKFQNLVTEKDEWSDEYLSPVNAHYLYVMIPRFNNSTNPIIDNIWQWTVNEVSIGKPQEIYDSQFKGKIEITFLSIGNSYSEDIFGYVPYIMRQVNPNIKMTGLMLMQSANTSANPPEGVPESHYRNFVNNAKLYYYSRWYSNSLAWRQSGGYNTSIKDALRGREITYDDNNQEVVGAYIDPENRPRIDVIFLQAAASSERANFKFTNALIRKITDYLGYPVQIGLFSAAYRSSTSNNGNAYSYDYILYNSLGNLEFAKRFVKSTPGSFLVSGCSAIQNARSIDALKVTGSYMDQASNTSGCGYLSSYDGNHISDGIGRQTYAYAVVGSLLKNMGFNWKGIIGDKTVMDGEHVKWISCPHPHGGTIPSTGVINTYGTDATTIAISQFCAAMAIEHPFYIYDLNNYDTEIDLTDSESLNVETMEFKRIIRISQTLAGVTSSNTSYYVMEGDDFDTILTGTITSVKVLLGDLDITRLAYNSETQTIHIGNVSETVTISVE